MMGRSASVTNDEVKVMAHIVQSCSVQFTLETGLGAVPKTIEILTNSIKTAKRVAELEKKAGRVEYLETQITELKKELTAFVAADHYHLGRNEHMDNLCWRLDVDPHR